ncbi:MAG: YncE family protein [Alphaproteobacteria bacterium]|nr:YncE family protein [Alphaproteobacteria bacterium]
MFRVVILLLAIGAGLAPRLAGAGTGSCDGPDREPVYTVDLPGHPFGVIATPDDCWVFVSLLAEGPAPTPGGVAVLSRTLGRLKLEHIAPYGGIGMVLSRDGRVLVVADRDQVLLLDVERLIDGTSDPLLGAIRTATGQDRTRPQSFYVNVTPDDRLLFVSDENAARITVIDFARVRKTGDMTTALLGRIPVDPWPIAVTLSKDGRLLFVTSQVAGREMGWPPRCALENAQGPSSRAVNPEGVLTVIDVTRAATDPGHAVGARVPAGCNPVRLVLSPDGETAWVTARGSNALIAFDTGRLVSDPAQARLGLVQVGKSPVGESIARDGKHVWVANSDRFTPDPNMPQTVTVVDISAGKTGPFIVEGTIRAGAFPRELHLLANGRTLLLTNYASRTLQVIDTVLAEPVPQ